MKSAENLPTEVLKELVAQAAIVFQSSIKMIIVLLLFTTSVSAQSFDYMPIPVASGNNNVCSFAIHELKQHKTDIWYVVLFTLNGKEYTHQLSARHFLAIQESKTTIKNVVLTEEGLELKYTHTLNPNSSPVIQFVRYGNQEIYINE